MKRNTLYTILGTVGIFSLGLGGAYFFDRYPINLRNSLASVEIAVQNIVTPPPPPEPSVTLTFAGDIMLDRGVESSVKKNLAGDYAALFAGADMFLRDDITFLNLEGPVSDTGRNVGSIYSFRMDPTVIPIIHGAGVDTVSFANNHVGDYSTAAFSDTMARLTAEGLPFSGAGINHAAAAEPTIIEKNGIEVGYLSFSDVGPNWIKATDTKPGILLASDPDFSNIISNAKLQSDVLVVSFHWGVEYKPHTARQTALAHAAIDAGADIIAGHHPHVAQDLELYKGKPIMYSLGNFIFDQHFSGETMQGMVVQMEVKKDGSATNIVQYINQMNKFFQVESIIPKNDSVVGTVLGDNTMATNSAIAKNVATAQKTDNKAPTGNKTITIGWVGDIAPSGSIPSISKKVVSWLEHPDFMIGNLEGALSGSSTEKCSTGSLNCFSFIGSAVYADALSLAGFDGLNLANNHTKDGGGAGITSTKTILSDRHLYGLGSKDEAIKLEINGVPVTFLGFGTNSWTNNLNDTIPMQKMIELYKDEGPVIVLFHGGAEGEAQSHTPRKTEYYIGEKRGNIPGFAHAAIDAGADLILGSGPHVIRGIERYQNKLIVYSAGNFLAAPGLANAGMLGRSGIFEISIDEKGDLKKAVFHAVWLDQKNSVVEDNDDLADTALVTLSAEDFGEAIHINADGTIVFER